MNLKETIQIWTDKTVEDLKDNYNRLGLKASGSWERALKGEVAVKDGNYHSLISGKNYTKFMEEGREKTRATTLTVDLKTVIRQWIDDKGIQPYGGISKDSLAFIIARKIHEQGIINAGGLVTDVIAKNKGEILKDLAKVFTVELKSDLLKAYGSN